MCCQRLIDIESNELNKWNLETNPTKSHLIKYTRNKKISNTFNDENDLKMNGVPFKWSKYSNIVKFLGFKLNFNDKNYLNYHFRKKINNFIHIKNKLFFKSILGNNLQIDIQNKLYKNKIRMALLYGLKIINMKQGQYNQLDNVQHRYITTIIGSRLQTNDMNIRILLGIPKLSDFLIKTKLLMYYDIFKMNDNKFTSIIKLNYYEMHCKYIVNGYKIEGMDNQWAYPTIDWINILKKWHFDDKYIDINNLPQNKNEWKSIVLKTYSNIYTAELDKFISKNGRIFASLIGPDVIYDKYKGKIYPAMIDELKFIYDGNISSSNIKQSIKTLFNWTKLNWFNGNIKSNLNSFPFANQDDPYKYCPLCGLKRMNVQSHLIWVCKSVKRTNSLSWLKVKKPSDNISFLKATQILIDDL